MSRIVGSNRFDRARVQRDSANDATARSFREEIKLKVDERLGIDRDQPNAGFQLDDRPRVNYYRVACARDRVFRCAVL